MATPATNYGDVVSRIAPAVPRLQALGVKRLQLFGSLLRGEATPASDADLLVTFVRGEKNYVRFLEVTDVLEKSLGRHVDLVTVESLSRFIGPPILKEARDVL